MSSFESAVNFLSSDEKAEREGCDAELLHQEVRTNIYLAESKQPFTSTASHCLLHA